jgi:hypothetical protein|tara:strand:+ start:1154 stop:1318 length:165 start_codon:yes stop_codon:yes gene_type:complete
MSVLRPWPTLSPYGRLHGQDAGLLQADVAQDLAVSGEAGLLFFFALFYGHDVPS